MSQHTVIGWIGDYSAAFTRRLLGGGTACERLPRPRPAAVEGVTMVGGIVIGLAHRHDGTTLIHVQGTRGEKGSTCSVRCRGKSRTEICLGDQVWWQCGSVYWTPNEPASVFIGFQHYTSTPNGKRQGVDFDIELEKIGYSH